MKYKLYDHCVLYDNSVATADGFRASHCALKEPLSEKCYMTTQTRFAPFCGHITCFTLGIYLLYATPQSLRIYITY